MNIQIWNDPSPRAHIQSIFQSLQNKHSTVFMLLFILLQVSAAYAGNQVETKTLRTELEKKNIYERARNPVRYIYITVYLTLLSVKSK